VIAAIPPGHVAGGTPACRVSLISDLLSSWRAQSRARASGSQDPRVPAISSVARSGSS